MTEFLGFFTLVSKVITLYGAASIGWILAGFFLWQILSKRRAVDASVTEANKQLVEAKDKYIKEIQDMNDKFAQLSAKHIDIVSTITEARIEDLKELSADYNQLASETLRTMDKLVVALEVSNAVKSKKNGGR